MKVYGIATLLLSSLCALALVNLGIAAPPENVLEPVPGSKFKPTLNFSDTYSQKVVTIPAPPPDPGSPRDPATHDVVDNPQKIAAKVVANIAGFDFAEVGIDLAVGLTFGAFEFTSTLGESLEEAKKAGAFPAGATKGKATFPFTYSYEKVDRNGDPVLDRNGDPITITKKVGSIVFSWTPKLLTVTLSVSDVAAAGVSEIGAGQYVGLYQDNSPLGNRPSGSAPIPPDPIPVTVTFGSAAGDNSSIAKGTSSTSDRKFGPYDEDHNPAEEFTVESVSLTGKAAP
jgi:hypothetical protein